MDFVERRLFLLYFPGCFDGEELIGIYDDVLKLREAYNRVLVDANGKYEIYLHSYNTKLTIAEYHKDAGIFEEITPEELWQQEGALPYGGIERKGVVMSNDYDYVTVIEAGEPAREAHGEAWGGQLVTLTLEQVKALRNGKQLAINVMDEYVLFLEGPMPDSVQDAEG